MIAVGSASSDVLTDLDCLGGANPMSATPRAADHGSVVITPEYTLYSVCV